MLAEEELIYYLRKITKELEFILDFKFCRFWAYMVKFPLFINFLDDYLQNLRKYNDLEKIQIDLDQSYSENRMISSGESI